MSSLRLLLLGSPRLVRDGALVEVQRRKTMALLAYLALTGEAHRREALAALLWPDYDDAQAHAYLRRALWSLKQALGEEWVEAERESISLRHNPNPSSDSGQLFWLDVAQFQWLLAACGTHGHPAGEVCPACLPLLNEAVGLYRADFMAGFTLPDSPEFDEWQFFQTESLRQKLASALERLVRGYSGQADTRPELAIAHARRWLALDPLHEPAHRQLMQLYAWAGQQAAALRQYQECVRLLDEELDVPPAEETTRLYEAIKSKHLPPPPVRKREDETDPVTAPLPHRPLASLPAFLEREKEPPEIKKSAFVARERELADLSTTLETARAGRGQILFVIGGAGRGKTTLVQEFARQAQAVDAELVVVSGNCNAHTGLGDPYLPFREVLNMLTGEVEARWAAGLITNQHAQHLWELMPVTLPVLVEHAPDLIESFIPGQALLNRVATFATEETPWFKRLATLVAEADQTRLEQQRLFAQYTAMLKAVARQRPLLLILEDLHWVDTSSSALLFHLSREIGNSCILMVGTYRPEEVALGRPSTGSGQVEQHPLAGIVRELKRQHGDIWLDLGELAPLEGRRFVEAYLDTQPNRLSPAFQEALFQHTSGHALFTVELVREMRERGDLRQDKDGSWVESAAIDWQRLPARVEGVIETCLARLEAALQAILTIASVEGEIFTAEVVARVQQVQERELVQRLSRELDKQHRLVTAQALARLNGQRLSLYRFRHYLFQHYLYHSLDELERAYLHEAVGLALEALYGDQTERVAGQLARHFEQAGLLKKAVTYLLQAGKRASQLSAHEEAITHLAKGLALLATLPDTSEWAEQELNLQIALGNALIAVKGYAAPEVGQTFSRARELCQNADAGETPQLFSVLHGLHRFYLVRAELQTARELGEQILDLAQGQQDPILLVPAHRVMGATLFLLGEFVLAQTHFEQGLRLYNPQQHHTHALLYGQDEGAACLAYASWALWFLGYPDQALQRSSEALTLAQKQSHPFSLAYALNYTACLHRFRREAQATHEWAETTVAIATEQGFALWLAMAAMYQGWALTEQGQDEEGMVQLHRGLAAWRGTGAELSWHYFLSLLAEAHAKIGQIKDGLDVVDEALAAVPKTGHYWEAELYRLKGELLWKAREAGGGTAERGVPGEDEVEAEKCFWQAIKVARQQEAKSLELRATVSLCRLWQSQGKREEAHWMLIEIYDWFTEGFETTDLKEAKVLLEEVS